MTPRKKQTMTIGVKLLDTEAELEVVVDSGLEVEVEETLLPNLGQKLRNRVGLAGEPVQIVHSGEIKKTNNKGEARISLRLLVMVVVKRDITFENVPKDLSCV